MVMLIILSCLTTQPAGGCVAPMSYISSRPISAGLCNRITEHMTTGLVVQKGTQYRVRCVPVAEAM